VREKGRDKETAAEANGLLVLGKTCSSLSQKVPCTSGLAGGCEKKKKGSRIWPLAKLLGWKKRALVVSSGKPER